MGEHEIPGALEGGDLRDVATDEAELLLAVIEDILAVDRDVAVYPGYTSHHEVAVVVGALDTDKVGESLAVEPERGPVTLSGTECHEAGETGLRNLVILHEEQERLLEHGCAAVLVTWSAGDGRASAYRLPQVVVEGGGADLVALHRRGEVHLANILERHGHVGSELESASPHGSLLVSPHGILAILCLAVPPVIGHRGCPLAVHPYVRYDAAMPWEPLLVYDEGSKECVLLGVTVGRVAPNPLDDVVFLKRLVPVQETVRHDVVGRGESELLMRIVKRRLVVLEHVG